MTPTVSPVLEDLEARGLIHDSTDRAALSARLERGPITLYAGFDPTADSLHVGNLVPLLVLRRFQQAGHRPIALAGGATGMIGDPSGRSEERVLLDDVTLDAHLRAITGQLRRLLDFDAGPSSAVLVDNRTWTGPVTVLEFLRDVGKHVTVNTMLAKESVRSRLASESGISFTEFSYMLLQANDYCVLAETEGCELQVGGSDQWGNITAGIDLARRRGRAEPLHGLTVPLVTRSDGAKFGKSQGGNVWLDPARTSPYQLHQYWMQIDDADVERFLLQLTLLPVADCRRIAAAHAAAPHLRDGQRALADAVVSLVHGAGVVGPIRAASAVLFGRGGDELDEDGYGILAAELPVTELPPAALAAGLDSAQLMVDTGLAASRGEVRRNARGYYVNDVPITDLASVGTAELRCGRFLLLRRGKANHHLVVVG